MAKALENSEIKVNALQSKLEGLQQTRDKVFQAPPIDWIEEKLVELNNVQELFIKKLARQIALR